MEVIGYVSKIGTRNGTGRNGKPYTAYNVQLTDADGNIRYVGWGFNSPTFGEGTWIKTTVEQNGDYLNYKGAPVETKQAGAPATAPTTQTGSGQQSGAQSRNGYWEAREQRDIEITQPRIQYQAARRDAVQLVTAMLAANALPISAAQGKTGESKRYEQILEFVDKIAVQFHYDTETLRVLDRVADAGDVEVPVRGELPDESIPDQGEFSNEDPF